MFDKMQTMLPTTATDLVKALDILEERLFQLPLDMISKDPMTVSEALLDHLAWENSVDAWDTAWPELVKRKVIAFSAEVHRFKGTPFGIKHALSAFGIEIELVEWWETQVAGVPGTFLVRAFVTDPLDGGEELGATPALVSAITDILNGVSPVSRGWSLQLGVRAIGASHVGSYSTIYVKAVAEVIVDPPPLLEVSASFVVHPHTQLNSTVTATKE